MTLFENKCYGVTIASNYLNKTPTLFTMLGKYFSNFRPRNTAAIVSEILALYYFVLVSHDSNFVKKVYQFSKVEKNSLENDKGSEPFDKPCKGLPFVAEGSQ